MALETVTMLTESSVTWSVSTTGLTAARAGFDWTVQQPGEAAETDMQSEGGQQAMAASARVAAKHTAAEFSTHINTRTATIQRCLANAQRDPSWMYCRIIVKFTNEYAGRL